MKQAITKKRLTWAAVLLMSASIWVVPVTPSYATDDIVDDAEDIVDDVNGSVDGVVDDVTGVVDDVTGVVDDIQGTIDGIMGGLLSPVQDFMSQIESMKDAILGQLEDLISGQLDDLLGGLDLSIEDLLGELNLPDLTALLEKLDEKTQEQLESGESTNPIHMVNPSVYNRGFVASMNVEAARLDASSVLSIDAQRATNTQLGHLQSQVTQGIEMASGTAELSQQSSQLSQESGTISQQASTQAQQAQSRVSTQDALKDLNMIAAMQNAQLASLSSQESAQSGQLSNISSQMATELQLDSAQLLRLNQMVTGMAVANQNLADMNEQLQGQERARMIGNRSVANRIAQINSMGYTLAR